MCVAVAVFATPFAGGNESKGASPEPGDLFHAASGLSTFVLFAIFPLEFVFLEPVGDTIFYSFVSALYWAGERSGRNWAVRTRVDRHALTLETGATRTLFDSC